MVGVISFPISMRTASWRCWPLGYTLFDVQIFRTTLACLSSCCAFLSQLGLQCNCMWSNIFGIHYDLILSWDCPNVPLHHWVIFTGFTSQGKWTGARWRYVYVHIYLASSFAFFWTYHFCANLHSIRCSKFPEWCITFTIWGKIEPSYGNRAHAIKWPSNWSNYKPKYWDGLLGQHSKLCSCNSWQSDPNNSSRGCGPSRAMDTGLSSFYSALYALCVLHLFLLYCVISVCIFVHTILSVHWPDRLQ